MYTNKLTPKFNNKYLFFLLGKLIGLIFIFNMEACNCKSSGQDNTASIDMNILKPLLIGIQNENQDENQNEHETKIEVVFPIDASGNRAVLGDFKLKVSILEQNTFTGTTTGSQIRYESAANGEQKFSESFEKLLTEFTNFVELDPAHDRKELGVNFYFSSSGDVIKAKLNFELLDTAGNSIRSIDVEWIKSEIAINFPIGFIGKETVFSLKPLKEDIKELDKYTVELKSHHKEVNFHFKKKDNGEAKATLGELLGRTPKVSKDQETNVIEIEAVNGSGNQTADFTILVLATDSISHSRFLGGQQETWYEYEYEASPEINQDQNKLEEMEDREQENNQELEKLQQEQKVLEKKKEQEEAKFQETKIKIKKEKKDKKTKQKEIENAKNKLNEIEEEIKKNENRQTELKNGLEGDKVKDNLKEIKQKVNPNVPKKLGLILTDDLITDEPFRIIFKNFGKKLEKVDLESIELWYEIKNSIGDTSKVVLKAKKEIETDLAEIEIQEGKKHATKLADIFETLEDDTSKMLSLKIDNMQMVQNMQIVIHLGGLSHHVPPVTVDWENHNQKHN